MKCINCKNESSVNIRDKNFCKSCFVKVFERKIFRTIKKYKLFSKRDKLGLVKGKNYLILINILRKITDKRNQDIKIINNPKKGFDKIILSSNLDDIASIALSNYLKNKSVKTEPKSKRFIIPLYFCTDEEIKEYSRIKNIKIIPRKQNKFMEKLNSSLKEIENRYKGTKNSIVNSYLESLQ